ncbi:MAG: ATPase, T2SS/T4P/T4SS family [Planctomycetota bacterium]
MQRTDIYKKSLRHFLKPIVPLLEENSVSEIMAIGHDTIYYEEAGKIRRSEARFSDEAAMMAAVRNIAEFVNRRIDAENHSMDARLPTGERVHVIIPPASRLGPCLTIRKFQQKDMSFDDLVTQGSLSPAAAAFVDLAVKLHKNIIISGGTGTGKTTILNAFSAAIPEEERIVVIEDSSELALQQKHTVYLEAQAANKHGQGGVTIRDLFVDSLRMRPDRIIVGEVRRGEALDLVQSMLSGHSGSLTTVHANSPRDAGTRLETLCLLSDADLPVKVARGQVSAAIDLVVQLARLSDGSRRVAAISECRGLDADEQYAWNPLFRFQADPGRQGERIVGRLQATGSEADLYEDAAAYGLSEQAARVREAIVTEVGV